MIPCISVENMRLSDAYTIENLVPSLELMYRAAYGVYKAVNWSGKTAIVVGSGNNGGDGFALAWILLTLSLSYIPIKRIAWSLLTVVLSGQIIGWIQKLHWRGSALGFPRGEAGKNRLP